MIIETNYNLWEIEIWEIIDWLGKKTYTGTITVIFINPS